MTTLELQGHITENGDLEIQLPGLPSINVIVRIDIPDYSDWDHQSWTEEELQELMKPDPKSGAEIAILLEGMEPIDFVDPEIVDPVEWVQAQRRKEMNHLKPYLNGDQ